MAKSSKRTALFEVIHSDKRFARKSGPSPLQTPAWWYKNRPSAGALGAAGTATATAAPPFAAARSESPGAGLGNLVDSAVDINRTGDVLPAEPIAPATIAISLHSDSPAPVTTDGSLSLNSGPIARSSGRKPVDDSAAAAARSRRAAAARQFATDLQATLARWLRPGPALLILGIAMLAIGLVILAERHAGRAAQAVAAGLSTSELRQKPPQPDVLKVREPVSAPATSAPQRSAASAQPPPDIRATRTNLTPEPAITAAAPGPARVINLNYILVQSYSDKKMADDAADFLNKNGVPCTVEYGLPGWSHSYCVVGTDGYTGPSSPDFQAMQRRIETIAPNYAPAKSYRTFAPMAVKWKLDRPAQ